MNQVQTSFKLYYKRNQQRPNNIRSQSCSCYKGVLLVICPKCLLKVIQWILTNFFLSSYKT